MIVVIFIVIHIHAYMRRIAVRFISLIEQTIHSPERTSEPACGNAVFLCLLYTNVCFKVHEL